MKRPATLEEAQAAVEGLITLEEACELAGGVAMNGRMWRWRKELGFPSVVKPACGKMMVDREKFIGWLRATKPRVTPVKGR